MQLVGDEDDGSAILGHGANRLEQGSRLLGCEDGGRLVEDEDAGVLVQRLQDFYALLFSERQLPDASAWVDRQAVPPRQVGDAALDRTGVEQKRPPDVAMVAEDDVLGDRERRHEAEVLVDHRDPGVERVARRLKVDRLTEQHDLPLVRPVQARQYVRQRRLAGAVLAEQGVHLARGRFEVDVLVRDDGRKPLRDAAQRNCRRWRGGLRLPAGTISPWRYRSRL